ncbi:hypothetical protein HZA42_01995 [Candidatus Peregrinibacteria bacterium]|nr:hypothetical protein [Candidatus Peregrinibacteria bacterium]
MQTKIKVGIGVAVIVVAAALVFGNTKLNKGSMSGFYNFSVTKVLSIPVANQQPFVLPSNVDAVPLNPVIGAFAMPPELSMNRLLMQDTIFNNSQNVLYALNVKTANPVAIKKMSFSISKTRTLTVKEGKKMKEKKDFLNEAVKRSLSNFKLYKKDSPDGTERDISEQVRMELVEFGTKKDKEGDYNSCANAAHCDPRLLITWNNEEVIPQTSSPIYIVKADIADADLRSGDVFSVIQIGDYDDYHGQTATGVLTNPLSSNFVWSPLAAFNHSVNSPDWENGFGEKLPDIGIQLIAR